MNASNPKPPVIDPCWSRIGVWGDSSARCPKLDELVHCRNCNVYTSAGRQLLDRPLPEGHLEEWRAHYARPARRRDAISHEAILVFRIGNEWLALSAAAVEEIIDLVPVHSIPHRSSGMLQGVAHIHGRLLLYVSLEKLLGIDDRVPATVDKRRIYKRTVLIAHQESRFAFTADEVSGCQRHAAEDLRDIPATLSHALAKYSLGILLIEGKRIGRLDDELLFYTLENKLG